MADHTYLENQLSVNEICMYSYVDGENVTNEPVEWSVVSRL